MEKPDNTENRILETSGKKKGSSITAENVRSSELSNRSSRRANAFAMTHMQSAFSANNIWYF